MKHAHILLLSIVLIAVSGCNNNEDNTNQSKQESDPVLIKNHQFSLGTEGDGEFYKYKSLNDIGTYETGPVVVNLERVEVVRGSFNQDYSEVYNVEADETLEMINFHIKFELNKEIDNFTFNQEHLHVITDNSEKIEKPNELLSSVVHASILKSPKDNSERYLRQFSFRLKESTAEKIEKATLIIDPPVDSNGDLLGEEIEIEVDFSKDNG
ncbi:hypothetical protein [Virgibacillus salexigens]|uniref:hypothetical protein n=1 Tax=Virgibacillus salexigens TaxID=61016 RepID=UPI00190A6428|nr:hypothetical protein [Virgibacillus salexigens]